MGLKDYTKSFAGRVKVWNVVFCILQKQNTGRDNLLNENLALAQEYLLRRKNEDEEITMIRKAFVFGNHLISARDFDETDLAQIYYAGYDIDPYDFRQALCMALQIMGQQERIDEQNDVEGKNFLVILADSGIGRTSQDYLTAALRYLDLDMTPVLIKGEGDDCGWIEYFVESRGGRIYLEQEMGRFCL